MINPNELRIGNWIQCNDLPFIVDGVAPFEGGVLGTNLVYSGSVGVSIDRCEPIPLSVEWLEKFGFKQEDCDYIKEGFCLSYITTDDNFQMEYQIALQDEWKMIDILYVHTLQNLIFSLTGTELTIK